MHPRQFRPSRLLIAFISIIALVITVVRARTAKPAPTPSQLAAQSAHDELMATTDFMTLENLPDRWKRSMSTEARGELATRLQQDLYSTTPLPVENYGDLIIWSRISAKKMFFFGHGYIVRQDIFITGGRAAWALERLLNCELPPIVEDQKELDRFCQAYRARQLVRPLLTLPH